MTPLFTLKLGLNIDFTDNFEFILLTLALRTVHIMSYFLKSYDGQRKSIFTILVKIYTSDDVREIQHAA